jgi:hypothetical protein
VATCSGDHHQKRLSSELIITIPGYLWKCFELDGGTMGSFPLSLRSPDGGCGVNWVTMTTFFVFKQEELNSLSEMMAYISDVKLQARGPLSSENRELISRTLTFTNYLNYEEDSFLAAVKT